MGSYHNQVLSVIKTFVSISHEFVTLVFAFMFAHGRQTFVHVEMV